MLAKQHIINILRKEVVPALGCTEPIAVALASATAKGSVGGVVQKITLRVSPNIYKNGMSVGIPSVNRLGLDIAAALGAIGGDPSLKLEVLSSIDATAKEKAEALLDEGKVSTSIDNNHGNLYVYAEVYTDKGIGKCEIKNSHSEVCYIEGNGHVILSKEAKPEDSYEEMKLLQQASIEEIVKVIEGTPFEDIKFMLEGARMNTHIADVGLEKELGLAIGASLLKGMKKGILTNDLYHQTVCLTASGADARMSGYQLPVMSSAGSGNHGLTAILPIVAVARYLSSEDEKLAKALAISHIITAYIKSYTGKLTALCGCAVAAATGASASIVWLMEGTYHQIGGSIKNMVADVTGVICDGAKIGCSLKLSTAAGVAVKSAYLALENIIVPADNGIVAETVEQTIKNMGRIGTPGMVETDKEILDVMMEKNRFKISSEIC
ncbi:L-cysteine desulfidase family protein [Alkaliphilus serpentinus]|uniref:UPF0597 protein F8153_14780 n=1 Tax=Alkaliphilus serpentinus TaxID=1482731 RepID=A0A833HLE4_9FIRM|nr:L-serine ammonia-lyase, iron-sulfur-dependent, subunit alpha [Alkaliphilus serpentinus]KAB3525673.1 serine dehydratase subunit alpha family protein [Alkaliphilus serpentinus]